LLFNTVGCLKTILRLQFVFLNTFGYENASFNLETSVGREKDMQAIGVHGETEKLVVTLRVIRAFSMALRPFGWGMKSDRWSKHRRVEQTLLSP